MNILYVHGYNGSAEGGSYRALKRHLDEGSAIFGLDYCQDDCRLALEQIRTAIVEKRIDVVVGSSLGGFLTLLTEGIERYVINPCYSPSEELPKLGPHNGLPAPSPEMVATYARFEPHLKTLEAADRENIHILIGDNDELLGERYYDDIIRDLGVVPRFVYSSHHLSESVAETVCSLIFGGRREAEDAHKYSLSNGQLVKRSSKCGCFSCGAIFSCDEIAEWADDRGGKTAVCPHCFTDAVVPDSCPYDITPDFLEKMHRRWF